MHFEILVEDKSGEKFLHAVVPQIIGDNHTLKIHSFKGIGRIPQDLRGKDDPKKRTLLDKLPKLLKAYGKSFINFPAAVIVVCDLDKNCLKEFRSELIEVLNHCNPQPNTGFCIAIEEMEAWLLGDLSAITSAYGSKAKESVLNTYINDDICNTWEVLADAVYPGGARGLTQKGYPTIGMEKSKWAQAIAPRMNIEENKSPSFCYFRNKLKELAKS